MYALGWLKTHHASQNNSSVTGVHECVLVDLHFDNLLQFPNYFGMPLHNAKQLHMWDTCLAVRVRARIVT